MVIAESGAHEELRRLGEEQAALRRVATFVARGASPSEVFKAVIAEVGRVVPADAAAISRYEPGGRITMVGAWSKAEGHFGPSGTHELGSGTLGEMILETGRPGRTDYANASGSLAMLIRELGWRSAVGTPILVDGRLWGVVGVASMTERPLPPDTEGRLAEFTELLAAAIGNAESREELTRVAERQAALRRVATLVARGAPPAEVFEAVSVEVGRLISADAAGLCKYEGDGSITIVSSWSPSGRAPTVGARIAHGPGTLTALILETARPGRIDYVEGSSPPTSWRSAVGAPVNLEGGLWGVVAVASSTERPLPSDAELRVAEFTELVATAIANAESRDELAASRARVVATADATRQRIERDLHDGAQQQLVALALELRAARASLPLELEGPREELERIVQRLTGVLDELREIAHGIHPASLSEAGLGAALKTLARRSPVPVELKVRTDTRLPEAAEVAAYYVVSEALANAAKHAQASVVHVDVDRGADAVLRISVRDDGIGGAAPTHGSGLVGLKDRAEAMGGTMSLRSPGGAGTSLQVELPLGSG